MNPFLLQPQERLADWKQFRKSLSSLPETEQMERVARYFALAPLVKFAYDPDDLAHWPTPWDMIADGQWDTNALAVGMEATLRLAGFDPSRLLVLNRKDYDISDQRLVLQIDGKWLLNYDYAMVVEVPDTRCDILEAWRFDGKSYRILAKSS